VPVGVILPFTGELAHFGEGFRQGIELAQSESRLEALSFFYEDDASANRAKTVGAFQSLLKQRAIKIAAVTAVSNIITIDAIAHKKGVIAFSAFDSNAMIENLSPNSFGYGWSNELTGKAIAARMCRTITHKRVSLVVGLDEWSETMGQAFASEWRACGGEIVTHDSVELDDTDLRSIAARIATAKPAAVYFPLYGPALLAFAKQIRQVGYAGTLVSAEGITDAERMLRGCS
jgi:ABC-type branched-subunit amino acid transport system substrate-binding protein